MVRGIRGAVQVSANTETEIYRATRMLIQRILTENDIEGADVISVVLTATIDLDAGFPGQAVRDLGWNMVPVLCCQEMQSPRSMARVIRALLHVNSSKSQDEIRHQYLGETKKLRPDLCKGSGDDTGNEH